MKLLIWRLRFRKGFAGHVAVLVGGTAAGQLIGLAALPLLARIFSPAEFGQAALFASILGLVVVVSTFRYESAIPLPRRDRAAYQVVVLCFAIIGIVALLSGIGTFFLLAVWSQPIAIPAWLFISLMVVGTVVTGNYNVLNYWAVRKGNFLTISHTRIQQAASGAGAQLLLGYGGLGTTGLIIGQIIGQASGGARLATSLAKDISGWRKAMQLRGIRWAFRRYRDFPIFDTPASVLNVISGQAPIILFSLLVSPVLAGQYALAYRTISAPNALVGRAVSQVLLKRIAGAKADAETETIVLRIVGALAMLSIPPFVIFGFVATDIVAVAFGEEWVSGAYVFAWTALWTPWQLIASPVSVVFAALEKQQINTRMQAFLFTVRSGALVIGAVFFSPVVAVVAFSISGVVAYFAYICAVVRVSGGAYRSLLASISPAVAIGLVCAGTLYATSPLDLQYRVAALAALVAAWAGIGYLQIGRGLR